MGPGKPTSAQELRDVLGGTRIVSVEDQDGRALAFRIRQVALTLWDPGCRWFAAALREGGKAFGQRLADEVSKPGDDVVRQVILSGCVEPPVSEIPGQESVLVDDIMRRTLLARGLYAEIARLSLEGLATVETEVGDGGPRAPNRG